MELGNGPLQYRLALRCNCVQQIRSRLGLAHEKVASKSGRWVFTYTTSTITNSLPAHFNYNMVSDFLHRDFKGVHESQCRRKQDLRKHAWELPHGMYTLWGDVWEHASARNRRTCKDDRHGPLKITTRKNTTPVPAIIIWGSLEVPVNNGILLSQMLQTPSVGYMPNTTKLRQWVRFGKESNDTLVSPDLHVNNCLLSGKSTDQISEGEEDARDRGAELLYAIR